jgi:hypothetical protein
MWRDSKTGDKLGEYLNGIKYQRKVGRSALESGHRVIDIQWRALLSSIIVKNRKTYKLGISCVFGLGFSNLLKFFAGISNFRICKI